MVHEKASSSKPSTSSSVVLPGPDKRKPESSFNQPSMISTPRLSELVGATKKVARQTTLDPLTGTDKERKSKSVDPLLVSRPTPLPAPPSKRGLSPVAEASPSKKLKSSVNRCSACRGPIHAIKDCPVVVQGPRR